MQRDAPLCIKALGIHNNVLRKATATHAGHVIEQEGDSWAVAFHRPVDAAAFCLQVIAWLGLTLGCWALQMSSHGQTS